MANILPFPEETPLATQIKSLGDEELLDFWEETQFLERFLKEGAPVPNQNSMQYEKLILQELQLRSCRRCAATAQP
ncbi:hypothetical protein [Halodesulfovibrio spirochaetisodalis]|uniref:Uncharacterized protein n=1 Tax=Halodesulfovibrio spirochaetisodalis TaxID=1560234 RepID=A0A1B7XJN8_9BACT|nr:hypothetical protein [Halodesulfovibrio spirochaetisodalis]OBQ55714.1 hypothetical protein SP90_03555 [Halodesulfovibrio spirochaetisodalis]